jgi:hypothetical protein
MWQQICVTIELARLHRQLIMQPFVDLALAEHAALITLGDHEDWPGENY